MRSYMQGPWGQAPIKYESQSASKNPTKVVATAQPTDLKLLLIFLPVLSQHRLED